MSKCPIACSFFVQFFYKRHLEITLRIKLNGYFGHFGIIVTPLSRILISVLRHRSLLYSQIDVQMHYLYDADHIGITTQHLHKCVKGTFSKRQQLGDI